ncbi:oxygenase MpaB family protein [Amycolatopsis orientalis]|uniref:oxygenase MpaB family protein n=1 Tax=Amycolatopsis orientalis TaxID=31958 RepID=UPI0003A47BC6|nr:oxygenase MpaB family protein [Amycolatopsis orientalis]
MSGLAGGRGLAAAIAALDPVRDNEAITHLSLGVRYGDAMFVHGAYTVAFARQVASPSIARIVYRTGTGDMMRNVRRRNDHTLVFFGEMIRHGHSSEAGRRVIDRMEEIHARFGITGEDKLFTLGSLIFEPGRILGELGLEVFTEAEDLAHYCFWRGVGEYLGLDIPPSRQEFLNWIHGYEERLGFTDGGRALVEQLFVDWRRWFPGPARRLAAPSLLLLMGRQLREIHRLPEPPATVRRAGPRLVSAYLGFQGSRPHRTGRSWSDHFVDPHAGVVDIARYGHRPLRKPRPVSEAAE